MADDCMGLGQQVAFSSLLAFLPTVILLIGLLGLFGNGAFNSLEQFVGSVAPHGVISMIDLAKHDAAQNKSGSAIAFALGVVAALWAATGASSALMKAVNRAYDRLETRPFWKQRLIALTLVVATGFVLAGMFLLIVFGGALGDAVVRRTGLGGSFKLFWNIARWPIAFGAVLLFFALVYYLAPNLPQRSWRWLTPGSLVGAISLARALGPVRALHLVLELVLEDVRLDRRRDHPAALAQLQLLGDPLRRRAERRARPPGRHPRSRRPERGARQAARRALASRPRTSGGASSSRPSGTCTCPASA